jgi:predicted dehydrogenase
MIRIGLVDFDTSHVVAFTQRLNHVGIAPEEWIDGAQVVAGWPGDSEIMPERIPGYTEQLKGYGIEIVESAEALHENIDAVMIESQQGKRHLERARPFLQAGIPTFIDKPFAASAADADAIIALATENNAPLMSCSSLRYAPEIVAAVAKQEELGPILSADVWSACALHDGNPGLLHYGVHGVEMLYTLMGTGCQEVQTVFQPGGEVVVGLWSGGRIGVLRGLREGAYGFGFAAHYEKGHQTVPNVRGGAYYTGMLKAIVGMFQGGAPPIPSAEMREIMAFMDAALASREAGGAKVAVLHRAG